MQKKVVIFLLLLAPCNYLFAQHKIYYHSDIERDIISQYLSKGEAKTVELQLIADKQVTASSIHTYGNKYAKLLSDVQHKKTSFKSDERFLSWMFYKVHRKVLKNYKQYTSLASTLDNGDYDCLSATTLYALLLHSLDYQPEVVETNYHIYLFVNTEKGRYLIESTDPLNGFVSNKNEIEARISNGVNTLPIDDENVYIFKSQLNELVTLTKLAGLQYYNNAVVCYNNKDLKTTLALLEKASLFYHSQRITEFGLVLADAINTRADMADEEKAKAMARISAFITVRDAVASR